VEGKALHASHTLVTRVCRLARLRAGLESLVDGLALHASRTLVTLCQP